MDGTTRRRVLAGTAGAIAAPAVWTSAASRPRMAETPFTLGVASGEPAPDGVVLWTRLATRPLEPGFGVGRRPVPVRWEIAEDRDFRRPVQAGDALAVGEAGHSVHVEVAGLQPGREYWYRFLAGGHASPTGRTRTSPAPGADVGRLEIAYGSCQKYEVAYYAAHKAIAEDRPDLVLFLGDYIYEGPTGEVFIRPHPNEEAQDLGSYRRRYALYKSDPHLQAAHAAAPWMVVWDDHEVANDYGRDRDRSRLSPQAFLRRRAAAYQVFWENMPLRRSQRPRGPDMRLYRSLDWGRLAQIQLLDTRQFRNLRTCDAIADGKRIPDCAARNDPGRSLLGRPQEQWLHRTLRGSQARWNVLAQQYLIGELKLDGGLYSNDGWDGYTATRKRLLETWRDGRVRNPLALGGDIHCFIAGDLALEPGRPIASEFVGGSIGSVGRDNETLGKLAAANPHLKFAEGERRGYGRVVIEKDRTEVTFREVADATRPDSPVRSKARFLLEDGRPGLRRL